MNQTQFLEELQETTGNYLWSRVGTSYVAKSRKRSLDGFVFNPVTAVAHKVTGLKFKNTKRETQRAARAINMDSSLANSIYSKENRGHSQVVNGKIRRVICTPQQS